MRRILRITGLLLLIAGILAVIVWTGVDGDPIDAWMTGKELFRKCDWQAIFS